MSSLAGDRALKTHCSSLSPVILAGTLAVGLMFVGCGSSKSSSTTPTPAATALTTSFTATCAVGGCHGADGSATPTRARAGHGMLKGTTLTEAAFLSAVRNGSGTGMSKYDTTVMTDADVQTNFTVLTTK